MKRIRARDVIHIPARAREESLIFKPVNSCAEKLGV